MRGTWGTGNPTTPAGRAVPWCIDGRSPNATRTRIRTSLPRHFSIEPFRARPCADGSLLDALARPTVRHHGCADPVDRRLLFAMPGGHVVQHRGDPPSAVMHHSGRQAGHAAPHPLVAAS